MPIVKFALGTLTELSPDAANLRISATHSSRKDDRTELCYLWDECSGRVVSLRERNGYDDSDFAAVVEDADQPGEFHEVWYATTRAWTYPAYGTAEDATPEVRARYEAYLEAQAAKARQLEAERRAVTPELGDTVVVSKGRKVPRGTEGVIRRIVLSQYGHRVQLDIGFEYVWTAATNLTVVKKAGA